MKFQYFFYFYSLVFFIGMEIITQAVFKVNSIKVLNSWIEFGQFRLPIFFLLGLGGLVYTIFISQRTFEVYLSFFGKKENYVYLGDKLSTGFFGYLENDITKTLRFIPSFLDTNVYPNSSFHTLYSGKVVLNNGKGEYIKADFFYLGNLIIWTIFHLFMGMLSLIGFLIYLLSFQYHKIQDSHAKINIEFMFNKINEYTNNFLYIYIFGVIGFYILSIILIRFKVHSKELFSKKIHSPLPLNIVHRNIIQGKVIASEIKIPNSERNKSTFNKKSYKQFTIQFDEIENFNPPVCVNFSARAIDDGNICLVLK